MNHVKRISYLVNPKFKIRIAKTRYSEGERYVIVALDKNNGAIPLFIGTGALPKFILPPIYCNSIVQDVSVVFRTEELFENSEEQWFAANEEKLRIAGLDPKDSLYEWDRFDTTLFLAVARKDTITQFLSTMVKKGERPASVTIPLWDCASLLSSQVTGSFCIITIGFERTVVGYVKNGKLAALSDHWATIADFTGDPKVHLQLQRDLTARIRSISQGDTLEGVFFLSNENPSVVPAITLPDIPALPLPPIAGVPPEYIETYACAINSYTNLGFGSVEAIQNRDRLDQMRHRALGFGRIASVILLLTLGTLGLIAGVLRTVEHHYDIQMAPLKPIVQKIEKGELHIDSLSNAYQSKAGFFERESAVTNLLSALQTAFPDGVWADRIDIAESNSRCYAVDIIAFAQSTATIADFISRLGVVSGVTEVRLIYSEQTVVDKARVVRLSISCSWCSKGGEE